MKWKPENKDKLFNIIEEIITNQLNDKNYPYGLKDIDVSLINDMSYLFSCFEDDKNSEINKKINWDNTKNYIGLWNVSHITNMSYMFYDSTFNQNISHWNVSQVTDMSGMFYKSHFNQPIDNWNVSSVTNMNNMFYKSDFNQDIRNWDVSHVTSMSNMFAYSDFNQPLGNWNVSCVINMESMFYSSPFNQDISQWDVSSVINMRSMFYQSKFNQDISLWNVSQVTDMFVMFAYSSSFNHNLYTWINRLNENVYLQCFNDDSKHEKRYGSINNINDFIENQLTPPMWLEQYKKSNDKEKFELLKFLKHRDKSYMDQLFKLLKENSVIIDI